MNNNTATISLLDDTEAEHFHESFDPHWFDTTNLSVYAAGIGRARPYLLCGLAAASHWYAERERSLRFYSSHEPVPLAAMDFFDALSPSTTVLGRGTSTNPLTDQRALLPVRRIHENTTLDQVVLEFFENTQGAQGWLQGVGRNIDENCIAELLGNALEHSSSKPGCFVASWADNHNGPLSISVVDVGIGIPQHLRRSPRYKSLSDEDALREAVKEGVSGVQGVEEKHRGFGLHYVREAARNAGEGRLCIRSGTVELRAKFAAKNETIETSTVPEVPGTWVRLEFDGPSST